MYNNTLLMVAMDNIDQIRDFFFVPLSHLRFSLPQLLEHEIHFSSICPTLRTYHERRRQNPIEIL